MCLTSVGESTFGRARELSCELRKDTGQAFSQPGHSGTSPASRSPVLPESTTNLRADFRKRFQEVGKGWLENITDFKTPTFHILLMLQVCHSGQFSPVPSQVTAAKSFVQLDCLSLNTQYFSLLLQLQS